MRLFVCEASATGIGGHYLEYCIRVSKALANRFTPIIVVHKRFKLTDVSQKISKYELIPHFKSGYFEFPLHTSLERISLYLNGVTKLLRNLSPKSFLFTLSLKHLMFAKILSKKRINFLLLVFGIVLVLSMNFWYLIIMLIALVALFLAREKFHSIIRVIRKKVLSLIRDIYWHGFNILLSSKTILRAQDLRALIKKQQIVKTDVVFLTSASIFDLKAVFYLKKFNQADCMFWIVLRREYDDWGVDKHEWRYLASLLQGLNGIKIFVDTELLQESYSDVLNTKIYLLPIISTVGDQSTNSQKKYFMSYLGDIREEKGFDGYLNLLKENSFPDKRFFSHSYFPSTSKIEDLYFKSELNEIHNLEILDRPATTQEYFTVLSESETVYLNYDSKNYKIRSSGIFVECIHAGAIPIVSQGTWMHKQVSNVSRFHHENQFINGTKRRVVLGESFTVDSNAFLFQLVGMPDRAVKISLRSSLGLCHELYGWTDKDGVAYLPSPYLHESEKTFVVTKSSSTYVSSLNLANPATREIRWLGGIVLNSKHNVVPALMDYLVHRKAYIESMKQWKIFKQFHSEQTFREMLSD